MARIVTTVHRYKRPPRKREAVALAGPAIVRKAARPRAGNPAMTLNLLCFPPTNLRSFRPPTTTASWNLVSLMRRSRRRSFAPPMGRTGRSSPDGGRERGGSMCPT